MGFLRQLAVVALLAGLAHAADLAVLRNGFAIRHASREVVGANTRLHTESGSVIDVPTAQIEHFEHDDAPAPISSADSAQPGAIRASQSPAAALATAPKSTQPFDLNRAVSEASAQHLIDADLIQSIIRQESGGKVRARSNKGAQGLMQLMPGTAAKLGVTDAYDGDANVEAGTRYFSELLDRYNGDMVKALAAYNAGPHRVDQYKGVPPYSETRHYVAAIVRDFNRKKLAQMAAEKKAREAAAKTAPKSAARKNSAGNQSVIGSAPAAEPGQ